MSVESAISQLASAEYGTVDEFMAHGKFNCKVLRVYDADTVWVAIQSPVANTSETKVWRVCCRLMGIDAPEMPRSHSEAMTEYHKTAYAARDRLIELLTDVELPENRESVDSSGNVLPSLSDFDMQKKLDENRAILMGGLDLSRGMDKYGRYLARIKTRDGRDASSVLLEEGHAVPYGSAW
jgi:endonuclease YncB( thermonuclease family)